MNFKFTWKTTVIFVAALLAAAIINVASGQNLYGLGILVIVCIYLANSQAAGKK